MKKSDLGIPLFKLQIKYEPDIVSARQKMRSLASMLGFKGQDLSRLSTTVSELARNAFQYAHGGSIEFFFSVTPPQTLQVLISDQGTGISNLEEILDGTHVSQNGLGIGIIGSKKLMDDFEISSSGQGTIIRFSKVLYPKAKQLTPQDLTALVAQLLSRKNENAFEEIQSQNRELIETLEELRISEEALSSLNNELSEKKLEADFANKAKSRFLANMSHEIRTPLGIIMGFTDLALEEGITEEERMAYLKKVKQNAINLSNLLGHVLDMSKVEANKLDVEVRQFSVVDLVNEIKENFSLIAAEKNLTLAVIFATSFPTHIESDPLRLRQILTNLISNALKFTDKGGVTITASSYLSTDGTGSTMIEFNVEDTGIGLSEIQQTKLFEPFVQADTSTTRRFGGTGLGLNLSKSLAELLGGGMYLAKSVEGKGSVFTCRIRVGLVREQDLPADVKPKMKSKVKPLIGMDVLLVEDSKDNQVLFSHYLLASGVTLDIASDGLEGLEKARQKAYHTILMDIQMPLMDGYGATKSLRDEGSTTPIIALTAHAALEERNRALMSGFDDYLTKPVNPELLIQKLLSFFPEKGPAV